MGMFDTTPQAPSRHRRPPQVAQQMPPVLQPKQPPDIPPGWRTGAPDFVGIGTMRSGTSWWWHLLAQHPCFARPSPYKEVHFFDHYMGVKEADPEGYYRYFPRAEGMVCGEWTPRYVYDYWAIPMLRQVAPDAKILVMLRDPIERYRSGLAFNQVRGFPPSHALLHHQFERSLYGQQLDTVLTYFPPTQMLVMQYERCVRDTDHQVRRTLQFIGLDPGRWQPAQPTTVRVNENRIPKPDLDPADRRALAAAFRGDLARLFGLFPDLDPSLWPTAAAPSE
jgi:hypothetical protein